MRPKETDAERITAVVLAVLIAAWLVAYAFFCRARVALVNGNGTPGVPARALSA